MFQIFFFKSVEGIDNVTLIELLLIMLKILGLGLQTPPTPTYPNVQIKKLDLLSHWIIG